MMNVSFLFYHVLIFLLRKAEEKTSLFSPSGSSEEKDLPRTIQVQKRIEAITMLKESTEYTDKLWKNARYFKDKISKLGYDIGNSETPITPVIIGDEALTGEFSKKLFENGLFVSPILFPTVPKGTARVRCMVTAGHSEEQLDKAVEIFEKVGKDMGILK